LLGGERASGMLVGAAAADLRCLLADRAPIGSGGTATKESQREHSKGADIPEPKRIAVGHDPSLRGAAQEPKRITPAQ